MKKTNKSWSDHDVPKPPKVNLSVVIGRFQMLHTGHTNLFKEAANAGHHVLILVGSSYIARTMKDTFTFEERREVIAQFWQKHYGHTRNLTVMPLIDFTVNTPWIAQVQSAVNETLIDMDKEDGSVTIVGHRKDHTSYYLDMFPKYGLYEVVNTVEVSATTLRYNFFMLETLDETVMPETEWYTNWKKTNYDTFKNIQGEYNFITNYKKQFEGLKYPPIFVTSDAIVLCNGHILLVKRRSFPGKGLLALPGGFLQQNETIEDGMLRELIEETKIGVSKETLRLSIQATKVFDAPNRSLRGRTITHASLIVLNRKDLPTVKGSDDAVKADWVPIAELYNLSDKMFEDHYQIANYLINRVR